MQKAVILGAGGFGREVLSYARSSGLWNIVGFLDANPKALTSFDYGIPILGDPLSVDMPSGLLVLSAIGDPDTKLALCSALRARGARFATLIHPTAIIGPSCEIGLGSTICPFSIVTSHVRVGEFVTVNAHCSIGHDASIGDGCTLSPHCGVAGGAVLGKAVFMGTHASVTPRVEVGDGGVIGAGSVAMWRVRPHSSVIGVPAVTISTR